MELSAFLDRLGLTQYEQKVYLALLKLGTAKSQEITKESSVPYGRIYAILEQLVEKGLVSALPTKPRSFQAIQSHTAFKLLLKRKENELKELEHAMKTVKLPAQKMPTPSEKHTEILQGKKRQRELVHAMTGNAQKEILVITGKYDPNVGQQVAAQRALQQGVTIRRIVPSVKDAKLVAKKRKRGEDFRQLNVPGLRLKVIDRQEAMLTVVEPGGEERLSFYTTNAAFAGSMAVFFESLWKQAKPLL